MPKIIRKMPDDEIFPEEVFAMPENDGEGPTFATFETDEASIPNGAAFVRYRRVGFVRRMLRKTVAIWKFA